MSRIRVRCGAHSLDADAAPAAARRHFRKDHAERGAFAGRAVDVDVRAVPLRDAIDHGEAQA